MNDDDDQSHGAAEWAPLSNFSCFDESPGRYLQETALLSIQLQRII